VSGLLYAERRLSMANIAPTRRKVTIHSQLPTYRTVPITHRPRRRLTEDCRLPTRQDNLITHGPRKQVTWDCQHCQLPTRQVVPVLYRTDPQAGDRGLSTTNASGCSYNAPTPLAGDRGMSTTNASGCFYPITHRTRRQVTGDCQLPTRQVVPITHQPARQVTWVCQLPTRQVVPVL
jgi:hypothetical protein